MLNIETITEGKRGCGYRKPGGLYLRSDSAAAVCGKLPVELSTCPCCGEGIKFSRAPRWIKGALLNTNNCATVSECTGCPFRQLETLINEQLLLIWIGENFYHTPEDFIKEGRKMGLSRRIKSIPRGFEVGKTWVALAHIHAVTEFDNDTQKQVYKPGVFSVFKPQRIEYVVTGKETEEELLKMQERGISLVKIVRPEGEQKSIPEFEMETATP